MKPWAKNPVLLFLGIAVVVCLAARAQLASLSAPPAPVVDSFVQITAEAQGLERVLPADLPRNGTFWLVMPGGGRAPLPCPPYDLTLPVYQIADGQYLVDDTGGQVFMNARQATTMSAAAALDSQANDLADFIVWIQDAQLCREFAASFGMDLPFPGGGGGGTNYFESGFTAQVFTTNDLWLEITGKTNTSAYLTIHPPWNVTNGVYDLFATTNLAPSAWRWVTRCLPGQTHLTVTNLTSPMDFFILGLTNDTDGGGLSDAYEKLVTQTDPNRSNDDRLTPLVGIQVTDAVAVEQNSANTAAFAITRLGGYVGLPLTVNLGISGTATVGTDYTLSSGSVTGTNFTATIPSGQTSVTITLAALTDALIEGSETTTLTVLTNVAWEVDTTHQRATAWILEEYTKTYTTVVDFNSGVLSGLEALMNNDDGRIVFKTNLPPQFPFINVACSARGTVARINTTNGMVIGEYLTAPSGQEFSGDAAGSGSQPSRTTVDQYGNVWVANRNDNRMINGTNYGSITRIGLVLGTRYTKTNAVYNSDPNGQYINITNAIYNTCIDRDADGYIRTSSGLADILDWNNGGGADSEGGVSTADDEAITEYTRLPCTGTRTIAVDKFNDIWAGGHTDTARRHVKVNGLTGSVVPNSVFSPSAGGYGGVIDGLGNLWSADVSGNVLWLVPPTNLPPTTADWQLLPYPTGGYGIAVDPVQPYIWQTFDNYVVRWNTDGTPCTNNDGSIKQFESGIGTKKGLAVDANGDVWVAHAEDSTTVGQINTNGDFVGDVNLQVSGLYAEYFANTSLAGWPDYTNVASQINFSYTTGWPDTSMLTNQFSARWSGIVQPQIAGSNVFYVSAEGWAAFRLKVNGTTIIDHWTNRVAGAVVLSGTNWLGTNTFYDLKLEYAHYTNGAVVVLSWQPPGGSMSVIPASQFVMTNIGPTGISVDAAGKIWAACLNSSTAVRIDPNAGPLVVTNGVTNHVGLVDMVVDLGNGDEIGWFPAGYQYAAKPYNYSDMTGFNERVVNPAMKPLKGYWTVINDSGTVNEFWKLVSWNASATNGSAVEVYIRANNDRAALADEAFVQVANNASIKPQVQGRFIELRLALTRNNSTNQPVVYDLTLHGNSSGFDTNSWLDDVPAPETGDASFMPYVVGAGPFTYQWYVQYPWMNGWDWTIVTGGTNLSFTMTNVDSFVDWAYAGVQLTCPTGETLWLGPAQLAVVPLTIHLPSIGSIGAAERYPATINVFGQPTNLTSMKVTLSGLSHGHSADLGILLVSPFGTNVMLMSHVGGTNGVSGATLVFWQGEALPPTSAGIASLLTTRYSPSNYGNIANMLGAPAGNYSTDLGSLYGNNPNGVWELYIYDDHTGGIGSLSGSWQLDFTF